MDTFALVSTAYVVIVLGLIFWYVSACLCLGHKPYVDSYGNTLCRRCGHIIAFKKEKR